MVVVPIKWIPYLLVISGIYSLFSGDVSVVGSLVMLALGSLWLFLKYSYRSSQKAQNSEELQSNESHDAVNA